MPNELTPVNVFHIGKGNILVVFAGIFEIEGGARQEDKIAIGVLGNRCRVARHKPIKDLSPARRDPSSKLKLGRTPFNFQSIFGGKPGFEDVELEWANDADEESGAIGRQEDLGYTFLG